MSTYRDLTAPIGSRRATALRTAGTRERRSHLTAPRVPTVGIDIGGTKVMAGVVDADGNILEKLRTETPDKSKSPKVVEDTIVELVLDLSDRHDVHAVGIGAAGWVDADRNRVLFAPHLSWRNEPLRDRIADRLAVPVLVDNDANTAAWAEWRFGAGRGEDHLVMITLGTGIGGAILEDGQVKRGKYGVAGEFGHMQVVPGGHRCPCGNRGCWEQYSSGNALVREARELAAADSPVAYGIIEHVKGNIGDITGPMITELAREGDAMCTELLQDIGQWLGVGIANLAAALDPSCFVIGGGVSAADDLLIGPRGTRSSGSSPGAATAPRPGSSAPSSAPRPAWSAPPTWPAWSPAASGAPSAAAWSASSATNGSPRPPAAPPGTPHDGRPAPPLRVLGRAVPPARDPRPRDPPPRAHPADHRSAHRRPGRLPGDLRQPEPRQR